MEVVSCGPLTIRPPRVESVDLVEREHAENIQKRGALVQSDRQQPPTLDDHDSRDGGAAPPRRGATLTCAIRSTLPVGSAARLVVSGRDPTARTPRGLRARVAHSERCYTRGPGRASSCPGDPGRVDARGIVLLLSLIHI